ncbi:MAG: type II secretion system major pseudopilin GspG [Candidatus Nitrohelix vancouverensis]|uniref:Type II secretion system core protein G n=1 Tax=Candidatus Nitrohelix vancouverensis TaxID=2705534 RepID=A0A7T0G4Z1_9BACT|nr:MAG: type II secretion system major pseudopilin GspG [Candidatus Nitrohelix vancouverensis]
MTRASWSLKKSGKADIAPSLKKSDLGFTLIELMVVMVIIALLAGLVVPKFFGQVDKAMQQDAQAQIELLGQALDLYRLEKHKYPTTDQGLEAIQSYLKKEIPKDPWGNPYVYKSPGQHGDYDLVSYGADNAEGGEEINQDIVSWKHIG